MAKQKIKQTDLLKKNKQTGILHIQGTRNNTIITLTDLKGDTKSWTSAGALGFKNSRKSTGYAAQAATEKIVHKGIQLGFDSVIVLMKGIGYGKQSAVRSVSKAGFRVTKVEDRTSIAHNGCRPAKKRRT